jgi:hypothetical protein
MKTLKFRTGTNLVIELCAGRYLESLDLNDPKGYYKVKMAPEIRGIPCDFAVDCPDFGVPDRDDFTLALVKSIYMASYRGMKIFVGCHGGIGRTGMFVAAFAKCMGFTGDPVGFARVKYDSRAVETKEQMAFVGSIDEVDVLLRVIQYYLTGGVPVKQRKGILESVIPTIKKGLIGLFT